MVGPAWRQYSRLRIRACWGARHRTAGEIARRAADFHARVHAILPEPERMRVNGDGVELSSQPDRDEFAILRGMQGSGMVCRNSAGQQIGFGRGAYCATGFRVSLSPVADDADADHFSIDVRDGQQTRQAQNSVELAMPYFHREQETRSICRALLEAAVDAWSPAVAVFGSEALFDLLERPRDDFPAGYLTWLRRPPVDPEMFKPADIAFVGGGVLLALNAPRRSTFTSTTHRLRLSHALLSRAGCLSMRAGD